MTLNSRRVATGAAINLAGICRLVAQIAEAHRRADPVAMPVDRERLLFR